MKTTEFDFELPEGAVARFPAPDRAASRLLVLQRAGDEVSVQHRRFYELPGLLREGDLLVTNDSRVLKARLTATKASTGGRVELLLVEPVDGDLQWRVLANASKPVRVGARLRVGADATATVLANEGEGFVVVELSEPGTELAARVGAVPLPPYLGRSPEPSDEERYQTVYARSAPRSVAAPTAGLHFTEGVLDQLRATGVGVTSVTLHVGPGTFLPVRAERVEEHRMHAEAFEVSEDAAAAITSARGRVVAVGTTVVRTLESMPVVEPGAGSTRLFIRPGHQFRHVDAMLTNFHLPKSTLLMLVAAFAGRKRILSAYEEAVRSGYRFYSYGDAMLIL